MEEKKYKKEEKITIIRENFSKMQDFLKEKCKSSRETSLAFTKLEEAEFWAIKSLEKEE